MDWVMIIGFLGATCTTTALFPQMVKSWRSKKTTDLSLPMCILLTLGVIFWLTYGVLISDLPLIVANTITLVVTSVILFLKIKYG